MTGQSIYTEAIAEEICDRISNGETLTRICKDGHMPTRHAVMSWVRKDYEGFRNRYNEARDLQIEYWADMMIEVALDDSQDYKKIRDKKGKLQTVFDHQHVQRATLIINTYKWNLTKLKPEKYGERMSAELTGKDGQPLMPEEKREPRQVAQAILELLRKANLKPEDLAKLQTQQANDHDADADPADTDEPEDAE